MGLMIGVTDNHVARTIRNAPSTHETIESPNKLQSTGVDIALIDPMAPRQEEIEWRQIGEESWPMKNVPMTSPKHSTRVTQYQPIRGVQEVTLLAIPSDRNP